MGTFHRRRRGCKACQAGIIQRDFYRLGHGLRCLVEKGRQPFLHTVTVHMDDTVYRICCQACIACGKRRCDVNNAFPKYILILIIEFSPGLDYIL